jgi:hypothetical protein
LTMPAVEGEAEPGLLCECGRAPREGSQLCEICLAKRQRQIAEAESKAIGRKARR